MTAVSLVVHTFSSIDVAALGFLRYRSPHPLMTQVLSSRYDLVICPIVLPSQLFFNGGEQKTVRWSQIRRIFRAINQFKSTRTAAIALLKHDALCQIFRPFWLNCLLHLSQQVGIIFSLDSLAFLKVAKERNSICIPEDVGHHLPCQWHHLAGGGEDGCFLWIRKCSRQQLDLLQKVPSLPATWPAWCAFVQVSKTVELTERKPVTCQVCCAECPLLTGDA